MHEWLLNFEYNMNLAAGYDLASDPKREKFQRCIFIAWPGNPKSAADYMTANKTSGEMGPIIAQLIIEMHNYSKDMQINIIGHSQGNGLLVKALDYLGENHPKVKINHAFFWQAAIPNYSLSNNEQFKNNFWYSPNAHKATKNISVLFSENDNILGKILEAPLQPDGVKFDDVLDRKPLEELLSACLLSYLELDSLYIAANHLGIPAQGLLEINNIDDAWLKWRKLEKFKDLNFETTLAEQVNKYRKSDQFTSFSRLIQYRIKKNQTKIDYVLKHAKSSLVRSGVKHLIHILENCHLAIDSYLNITKEDLYRENINNGAYTKGQKKAYLYPLKVISFLYAAEFKANVYVAPAMGYQGVDKGTVESLGSKLKNIKTTQWVYQHSDMKYPSEDIKNKIYKAQIVNRKNLKFGFHIGTGEA